MTKLYIRVITYFLRVIGVYTVLFSLRNLANWLLELVPYKSEQVVIKCSGSDTVKKKI